MAGQNPEIMEFLNQEEKVSSPLTKFKEKVKNGTKDQKSQDFDDHEDIDVKEVDS